MLVWGLTSTETTYGLLGTEGRWGWYLCIARASAPTGKERRDRQPMSRVKQVDLVQTHEGLKRTLI